MEKPYSQSFQNHSRIVPGYHYVAFPIFTLNLMWSLYRLRRGVTLDSAMGVLLAAGLILLLFYARVFALTVQDRVIRLEMRLRLAQLLPADLRGRMDEFSVGQLVSLRFASDAELPALARQVLDERLNDRKEIKKRIQSWKQDFLRA